MKICVSIQNLFGTPHPLFHKHPQTPSYISREEVMGSRSQQTKTFPLSLSSARSSMSQKKGHFFSVEVESVARIQAVKQLSRVFQQSFSGSSAANQSKSSDPQIQLYTCSIFKRKCTSILVVAKLNSHEHYLFVKVTKDIRSLENIFDCFSYLEACNRYINRYCTLQDLQKA